MSEEPSAMAANSAYRWEIDLSPGGRTRPRIDVAGCTTTDCTGGIARTIAGRLEAGTPAVFQGSPARPHAGAPAARTVRGGVDSRAHERPAQHGTNGEIRPK